MGSCDAWAGGSGMSPSARSRRNPTPHRPASAANDVRMSHRPGLASAPQARHHSRRGRRARQIGAERVGAISRLHQQEAGEGREDAARPAIRKRRSRASEPPQASRNPLRPMSPRPPSSRAASPARRLFRRGQQARRASIRLRHPGGTEASRTGMCSPCIVNIQGGKLFRAGSLLVGYRGSLREAAVALFVGMSRGERPGFARDRGRDVDRGRDPLFEKSSSGP